MAKDKASKNPENEGTDNTNTNSKWATAAKVATGTALGVVAGVAGVVCYDKFGGEAAGDTAEAVISFFRK